MSGTYLNQLTTNLDNDPTALLRRLQEIQRQSSQAAQRAGRVEPPALSPLPPVPGSREYVRAVEDARLAEAYRRHLEGAGLPVMPSMVVTAPAAMPAEPTGEGLSNTLLPLPLPPPSTPRQPTVGAGGAANARPSAREDIPMPPPAVAPPAQSEAPDKPRFQGEPRSIYDRISDFGFALAASRNPSVMGAVGEAGQAMTQADRQDRQRTEQMDQRQQELDINRAYREGQIRLAEAEAAYARDPSNPVNQLRLAQVRAALARMEGGGGGAAEDRTAIPMVDSETGALRGFFTRSQLRDMSPEQLAGMTMPQMFNPAATRAARESAAAAARTERQQRDLNEMVQAVSRDPLWSMRPPAEIRQRAQELLNAQVPNAATPPSGTPRNVVPYSQLMGR